MFSLSPREVGQRIATIRRTRRMTQKQLARAAFLSLPMIKAVERGARPAGASVHAPRRGWTHGPSPASPPGR
ncbi:hypothetical protein ABZ397_06550 [Streptomyces sp. NPDC005876]|uniref:hypothetical protein n=1 Tax=Streptomyces sp. NPDC005876 TaxID=3157076 RepID=UPI0034102F90